MSNFNQWIRKTGLILASYESGLDLSAFRIKFSIQNADIESPNTCSIRVYNLSRETMDRAVNKGEFDSVILNAGYENGNYGVIFSGTIKQFRYGKENTTDVFLDILAADGDVGYNQGFISTTISAGATPAELAKACTDAMPQTGLDIGSLKTDKQHTPSIRGTVLFGMARARLRNIASSLDASWSIQDGNVVMLDNTGYREGEAVVINTNTGMIGMPEQTDGGIKVRCLLNSRLRIGSLIQLNNSEIVQMAVNQNNPNAAPIPFNQWTGIQYNAMLSPDGVYRAFVVEHEGDSRGDQWNSNIICLAVDPTVSSTTAVSKQ